MTRDQALAHLSQALQTSSETAQAAPEMFSEDSLIQMKLEGDSIVVTSQDEEGEFLSTVTFTLA